MSSALLESLQQLPFAVTIAQSEWLFPTLETLHVMALTAVVGTVLKIDLRLLGLTDRERPFSALARQVLPWTWGCFAMAAMTGLLMFAAKAVTYWADIPFRIKFGCIALAGFNMAYFHLVGARDRASWDLGPPPWRAKLAGMTSVALWITVVAAGRWIGFTT